MYYSPVCSRACFPSIHSFIDVLLTALRSFIVETETGIIVPFPADAGGEREGQDPCGSQAAEIWHPAHAPGDVFALVHYLPYKHSFSLRPAAPHVRPRPDPCCHCMQADTGAHPATPHGGARKDKVCSRPAPRHHMHHLAHACIDHVFVLLVRCELCVTWNGRSMLRVISGRQTTALRDVAVCIAVSVIMLALGQSKCCPCMHRMCLRWFSLHSPLLRFSPTQTDFQNNGAAEGEVGVRSTSETRLPCPVVLHVLPAHVVASDGG